MTDKPKHIAQNPECLTQAQQDGIENAPGYYHPKHDDSEADYFQNILWERKIFVDIVDYDPEGRTCRLIGPLAACEAAKHALAKVKVKAKLPPEK